MKRRILMFAMALGLSVVVTSANSWEAENDTAILDKAQLKPQTHCPVMGGKIDSTIYADIQGQRIYFCCPGCVAAFKENSDKYFMKAAKERILFENIQTKCPVSGDPIDEDIFIYYEGRGIHFCSKGCISTFYSDPEKYLLKLDEMTEKLNDKNKVETKDHEHKHQ